MSGFVWVVYCYGGLSPLEIAMSEEIEIVQKPAYPRPTRPARPEAPKVARKPDLPQGKDITLIEDYDLDDCLTMGDTLRMMFEEVAQDSVMDKLPDDARAALERLAGGQLSFEDMNLFRFWTDEDGGQLYYKQGVSPEVRQEYEAALEVYQERLAARDHYDTVLMPQWREAHALYAEQIEPWRVYDRFQKKYGDVRKTEIAAEIARLQAELGVIESIG